MGWTRTVRVVCGAIVILLAAVEVTAQPKTAETRSVPGAIRVALLEFATDDNSYRSMRAGADFADLVQIELAKEPGLDWVERSELQLVRSEIDLGEMALLSGGSSLQRGKWAKADWVITGLFSLDDRGQRTLSIEVIDVRHADVLASQTLTFPEPIVPVSELKLEQARWVATELGETLSQTRQRWERRSAQFLVAPLFFADVTQIATRWGNEAVPQAFFGALEQTGATNDRIRLIRFPKAYQSIEESELVLDALVQADPESWQKTADLYIWGTHSLKTLRPSGRQVREVTLHAWNGGGDPAIFTTNLDRSSLDEFRWTVRGFFERSLVELKTNQFNWTTEDTRERVANSLVQAFYQMTRTNRQPMNLFDEHQLLDSVQMLETACFFDPGSAEAQALRISSRWGFWTEFNTVKNPFRTAYRRSQAWMHYADRFGGKPNPAHLPFPMAISGLGQADVAALEELLRAFPEHVEAGDTPGWNPLEEAQAHGFPKEIPLEVAAKWKAEVAEELAKRKRRATEHRQESVGTNTPLADSSSALKTSTISSASGSNLSRTLTGPARPRLVPAPPWLKGIHEVTQSFLLRAPQVLASMKNFPAEPFAFPGHFQVRQVRQIGRYGGQVIVLGVDQRSASSSAAVTGLSEEILRERGRIWRVAPHGQTVSLFEPGSLTGDVSAFLGRRERLWIAGEPSGWLDASTHTFHALDITEGFRIRNGEAFATAGEDLFCIGDAFAVARLPVESNEWTGFPLPGGRFGTSTDRPPLVCGDETHLLYSAESTVLYDLPTQRWELLPAIHELFCVCSDGTGVWLGGYRGLYRYDYSAKSLRAYLAPWLMTGLGSRFSGFPYAGGDEVMEDSVEQLRLRLEKWLASLEEERVSNSSPFFDPLQLKTRIPGPVHALANDGEYLWIGGGRFRGELICLHKPSLSVVGACAFDGEVKSLFVSEQEIWVGTAFAGTNLFRVSKGTFLSKPRRDWLPLELSADDRKALVGSMTRREQALYAFYSGDNERVVALLKGLNAEKAQMDEVFALAVSAADGSAENLGFARGLIGGMKRRWPGSPWAEAARECVAAAGKNGRVMKWQRSLRARFDDNQDGVLDAGEEAAMRRDPEYGRGQERLAQDTMEPRLAEILSRYDQNKDGALEGEELEKLRHDIELFSSAPPTARTRVLLAPLMVRKFPASARILSKYDRDRNKAIDLGELKAMAMEFGEEGK